MGQCQPTDKRRGHANITEKEPPRRQQQSQPHPQANQRQVSRLGTTPPKEVYVKVWGDGHVKCEGRYVMEPENGAAVWKSGAMRLYTDTGGYWIIGSVGEMNTGVGWFATAAPHRGKPPTDASLSWSYVARGASSKGWLSNAPIQLTSTKPRSAFSILSGGGVKATYDTFLTGLKSDKTLHAELGIPQSTPTTAYLEYFRALSAKGTSYATEQSVAEYVAFMKIFRQIDSKCVNRITSWDVERALSNSQELQQTLGFAPNLSKSFVRQMDTTGKGWVDGLTFATFLRHGGERLRKMEKTAVDRITGYLSRNLTVQNKVTLKELTDALTADREAQLELGWPAHQTSVIFHILQGNTRGYIPLGELQVFLQLTMLFNQIDTTRDGFIDAHEFGSALVNNEALQRVLKTKAADAQAVFSRIDVARQGSVSFVEFFRYFQKSLDVSGNAIPQHQNQRDARAAVVSSGESAYELRNKLGEGSYGVVYLVKRKIDGVMLIMKKPKIAPGFNMEDVRREARLLSKMKHPNIIRFVECFKNASNALVIITEFADGGDLRRKIFTYPRGIPEQQTMTWFVQICEAVKFVHSLHILHRDLKTDNIFLTSGGNIKLGDLGLAKQLTLDSRTREAVTHTVFRGPKGHPSNMSPEQVRGEKHGTPIDIWALGCILYEMATSKSCFSSPEKVLEATGTPPSSTPSYCYNIVRAALTPSQYTRPDIYKLIELVPSHYKDAEGCMATHITDRKHRRPLPDGGNAVVQPEAMHNY